MPTHPEPEDITPDDEWFGSRGVWQGRPILVRGRKNLTSIAGHPKYRRKLTVAWEYGDDGRSGMPTPETQSQMEMFEERLIQVLGRENHAFLVAAVTCAGSREWIWYTQDASESSRRINEAFAQEPRRPLRLEVVDDPNWAEYLGILRNFTG